MADATLASPLLRLRFTLWPRASAQGEQPHRLCHPQAVQPIGAFEHLWSQPWTGPASGAGRQRDHPYLGPSL